MSFSDNHLVWLDLEMTGLNPSHDRILEIATVITDSNLDTIAEGPVYAINQTEELLAGMDSWNKEHHKNSGLIERVKRSTVTEEFAEEKTLAFITQYVSPQKSPLCGNSICQDRRFLWLYMPKLESYFHYRNLDVSTIKILAQRWAPHVASGITKVSEHIALKDIHDSIEELRYYREHFIKS